jgi:hypothetical protein
LDLIQLWENHQFISNLTWHMTLTNCAACPTFEFDPIYSEILSHSPELLFVLKTQIISPRTLWIVLERCGLPFNFKIFQPFVRIRGLIELPFPEGDSPVDFLNDPRRARHLYSDPQDIADAFMGLWIPHCKQSLLDGWSFPYL